MIHKSLDPFKERRVNVDSELVHSEGKSLKKLTERKGTGVRVTSCNGAIRKWLQLGFLTDRVEH